MPRVTTLDVVTVLADKDYLYELLTEYRKRIRPRSRTARTYMGVETFMGGRCVEAVEAYYNGELDGYDLKSLAFKNGRIGLWPFEGRYFLSTETSRAFYLQQLTQSNPSFPVGPLELKRRTCQRAFILSLDDSYTAADGRTVEVISFVPRDSSGGYFLGRIWVTPQDYAIRKIELRAERATRHPFVAIGRADRLRRVDMRLAKTYRVTRGESLLESIDFDYSVDYRTRTGKRLSVRTAAIPYVYDYAQPFVLPRFDYVAGRYEDYRKIEATPYNPIFWQRADAFRRPAIAARLDTAAQRRVSDRRTLQLDWRPGQTLFQHYYLPWGPERFTFRSSVPPALLRGNRLVTKSDEYRLTGQIYLDINPSGDSLHVITRAVFDPFQSYFRLSQTPATAAFINLYLDLVELERRTLEARIAADGANTVPQILTRYESAQARLKATTAKYLKEVQRGESRKGMLRWNERVKAALGVDNVALFDLETYWAGEESQ